MDPHLPFCLTSTRPTNAGYLNFIFYQNNLYISANHYPSWFTILISFSAISMLSILYVKKLFSDLLKLFTSIPNYFGALS
jgi:hypothetical protein